MGGHPWICGRWTCAGTCPFQGNRQYLQSRVSESLGLLYATHYPFRQYETGRGVRKSAIHDRLARGGCLSRRGVRLGASQLVCASRGCQPVYEYSYGRQNWFEHSAATSTGRCARVWR